MIHKIRKFIKKHQNLNLFLSGISMVYIWRGVWSLSDMFTFGLFDHAQFWSYFVPMTVSFTYIYLNDFKLSELVHMD